MRCPITGQPLTQREQFEEECNMDYFTRPVQSDRNAQDYGHHRIEKDESIHPLFVLICGLSVVVIVLAVTVWS